MLSLSDQRCRRRATWINLLSRALGAASPDAPQACAASVRATRGFQSGLHYWEVEVLAVSDWSYVGVVPRVRWGQGLGRVLRERVRPGYPQIRANPRRIQPPPPRPELRRMRTWSKRPRCWAETAPTRVAAISQSGSTRLEIGSKPPPCSRESATTSVRRTHPKCSRIHQICLARSELVEPTPDPQSDPLQICNSDRPWPRLCLIRPNLRQIPPVRSGQNSSNPIGHVLDEGPKP